MQLCSRCHGVGYLFEGRPDLSIRVTFSDQHTECPRCIDMPTLKSPRQWDYHSDTPRMLARTRGWFKPDPWSVMWWCERRQIGEYNRETALDMGCRNPETGHTDCGYRPWPTTTLEVIEEGASLGSTTHRINV